MRIAILLVLSLGVLGACAERPRSGGTPTDPAASPESPQDVPEAVSTPYRLEEEGTAPPADVEFEEDRLDPPEDVEAEPLSGETVRSESVPIPPSVEVPAQPSVEAPVPPTPPATGRRGYRIQIAALAQRAEADQVAREATSRAGTPAYVVFESNLYKVRVGDYLDRAAALVMRDRCRSLGYSGAWVVTTQVQIPQS